MKSLYDEQQMEKKNNATDVIESVCNYQGEIGYVSRAHIARHINTSVVNKTPCRFKHIFFILSRFTRKGNV